MGTLVQVVSIMGQLTFKGNETKWKMKHPSNIVDQSLNAGSTDMWATTLPIRPWIRPSTSDVCVHV